MSRGFPSMTALLGLLAVAGYQNRDKIAEMLGGLGKGGPQTPGQFTLQFSGVDGHTYIVQTSTNLVDWNAVYTNQQSGGLFSYTNTNATDVVRFYRVQQ